MINSLKRLMAGYNNYATKMGRRKALEVLLRYDDRHLADMGISRGLLEMGDSAWPWRTDTDAPVTEGISKLEEQRAMSELQQYSDAELRDIGITRGTMIQAVRFGREGLDSAQRDKAA